MTQLDSCSPPIPQNESDRPYVTLWFGYKNRLEQVHKFIACLPERIGDRDWKIFLHDHAKGEGCNADCDIVERTK